MGLTALFSNPETPGHDLESSLYLADGEQYLAAGEVREPRQSQRRLEEADILNLVAQYIEGSSAAELARIWGVHRNTVVAHLDRHGVTRRPKRKLTAAQIRAAAKSYEAGTSLQALGDQLSLDKNTIGRELKKAGITGCAQADSSGRRNTSCVSDDSQGFIGGAPIEDLSGSIVHLGLGCL